MLTIVLFENFPRHSSWLHKWKPLRDEYVFKMYSAAVLIGIEGNWLILSAITSKIANLVHTFSAKRYSPTRVYILNYFFVYGDVTCSFAIVRVCIHTILCVYFVYLHIIMNFLTAFVTFIYWTCFLTSSEVQFLPTSLYFYLSSVK